MPETVSMRERIARVLFDRRPHAHGEIPYWAAQPQAIRAPFLAAMEEPSEGLLMSMALRLDHGLGCPGYYDQPMLARDGVTHAQRVEAALSRMRKVYEEIVGRGFYSPEREEEYRAMIEATSDQP